MRFLEVLAGLALGIVLGFAMAWSNRKAFVGHLHGLGQILPWLMLKFLVMIAILVGAAFISVWTLLAAGAGVTVTSLAYAAWLVFRRGSSHGSL